MTSLLSKNRLYIYGGVILLIVCSFFFLLFSRTQYLYKQNLLIARRIEELMQRTQDLQNELREKTRQTVVRSVVRQPPPPTSLPKIEEEDEITDAELVKELKDLEKNIRKKTVKESKHVEEERVEESKQPKEAEEPEKEKVAPERSETRLARLTKSSNTPGGNTETKKN